MDFEKLKQFHQEHLLQFYDSLTPEEKKNLEEEINQIDFSYMKSLYDNKDVFEMENQEITPLQATIKEKIDQEKYMAIGEQLIKEGKLAVCSMAGGQGTRLGFSGPKGTFMLALDKPTSIFETIIIKLKKAYEKYGVYLDWYIMTSHQNHEETIQFFETNRYFDYPKEHILFFQQGELPLLDQEGKIVLKDKANIFMAPDGNGGIFKALGKEKILQHMQNQGIQYLAIGNVDNILINLTDPMIIGLMQEKNIELASRSFMKSSPEGKQGVFCRMNGKPRVIEYTETPKELLEARNEEGELLFGDAHFGCNIFHISLLNKIVDEKLPMHAAFKKNTICNEHGELVETNTYKFEAFIFDAFIKANNITVFRVKEEEEFAPIKNKEGNESPSTAIALYKKFYHIEK